MIFAIVLLQPPKSQQAKRKAGYQTHLKSKASARYMSSPVHDTNLYMRVTWFTRKKGGPDVDNIVKPIFDALEGVVYKNDLQLAQILSTRVNLSESYTISNANISPSLYDELENAINKGYNHILYIEIGRMTGQQVVFGPIDGGA